MATDRGPDPKYNPLNADHYDKLVAAQRQYHDLLPEMDRAEKCGVDCQHQRAMAKKHFDAISNLLAEYFPQGRPS